MKKNKSKTSPNKTKKLSKKAGISKYKILTEEQKKKEQDNNVIYIENINKARGSKDQREANTSFAIIEEMLKSKIKKIISKFNIGGTDQDDMYQEALYALRFKAIKDYDINRGVEKGDTAPFEKFALLCIRRHLFTEIKTSFQDKRRTLNMSVSMNKEIKDGEEDGVFLSSIITDPEIYGTVEERISGNENAFNFIKNLNEVLSSLEKEVFYWYYQKLSYEEIVNKIKNKDVDNADINIKSIDNALMRVKSKAREIIQKNNKLNIKEKKFEL